MPAAVVVVGASIIAQIPRYARGLDAYVMPKSAAYNSLLSATGV